MDSFMLVKEFVQNFSKSIKVIPKNFYGTFEYTQTGCNYTHPRTWGVIVSCLSKMGNCRIDIDLRLNENGVKFQPDVVCRNTDDAIILIIDYESPNSSDVRIPEKDVKSYLNWIGNDVKRKQIPYVIITTLPSNETSRWELRYISKGQYNEGHKGKLSVISKNPFKYWYDFYENELKKAENYDLSNTNIYFLNINCNKLDLGRLTVAGKIVRM